MVFIGDSTTADNDYSNKNHGNEVRASILKTITDYSTDYGHPPTIREICRLSGLSSTSTVHHHLQKMLDEGMIEKDNGVIKVPNINS